MAGKILDDSGLTYFWGKLKTLFNDKVDKVTGKGLSTNDFTTAYKNKIDRLDVPLLTQNVTTYANSLSEGIYFAKHETETAYDKPVSNQRFYYIINVSSSETASIMAIEGQHWTYNAIYVKTKVQNIWGEWMQIAGNVANSISNSDDYIPTCGAVYNALSDKVDKDGSKVLSTNDYTTTEKSKLAGIEANANKTTIASSITQSGTNPVQSSAIYTALAGKVDTVSGKGLSTNDYTTTEKNKLAGIDTGANKTTVDSSLSSTSTNPVQNKVINTALNGKVSTVSGKGLSTNDFTDTYKGKVDRLDSPLLSKNVAAYADSISTAGVYFARHATTPAYDQPVSGTRYYYIINVYSSNTASIMALPGQPRAIGEIYTRIKTEGTWGAWYKFTGTAV